MSRNISPPPPKRQKIELKAAAPSQTIPPKIRSEALPPIAPDILRIFSWNVNGITPFLQKPITSFFQASQPCATPSRDAIPPASLRGFLQRHGWPAILFLQEVKIASKDTKTQDAIRVAVNSRIPVELSTPNAKGPLYDAHCTLPNDPHNARGFRGNGRVYGVCSIIRRDVRDIYKTNVRTVNWDKEGRVSVVELERGSTKLALFNIYAVNGTDNPYRDPASGAVQGTRHNRKLAFHRLLMEECMHLEKAGWLVLLAGDMNVAPDVRDGYPRLRIFPQQHVVNRTDFHKKLLDDVKGTAKGFNGVDIWRKVHGEERRYTYFSRGREWGSSCDRVDYFVAGRSIWDKDLIKACGILDSEAERGPSDHVPIWADVRLEGDAEV